MKTEGAMNRTKNEPARVVLRPIKNGRGEVKGYIEMFWSRQANGYVTIP